MLRADELTVIHHDDTVSHFTDVRYTLGRDGLRVVTAAGDEKAFPRHDVLTTHALARAAREARTAHPWRGWAVLAGRSGIRFRDGAR